MTDIRNEVIRKKGEPEDFHAGGSDASGIVWAIGSEVDYVSVGDEARNQPCAFGSLTVSVHEEKENCGVGLAVFGIAHISICVG